MGKVIPGNYLMISIARFLFFSSIILWRKSNKEVEIFFFKFLVFLMKTYWEGFRNQFCQISLKSDLCTAFIWKVTHNVSSWGLNKSEFATFLHKIFACYASCFKERIHARQGPRYYIFSYERKLWSPVREQVLFLELWAVQSLVHKNKVNLALFLVLLY